MLKRLRSAHPMLYCLVAEVLFLGMLFVASLLSLLLILFVVRDIDAVDDYMLTFMQEAVGVLVAWFFLARTGKSGLLRRRGSGFFNGLLVGLYPIALIGYNAYNTLLFGRPVFATPAMIALMENTAFESVASELEEGSGTVGTALDIKHVSATPVGMKVTCESELVKVDGRALTFSVKAFDEAGLIGEGTHERFIVFEEKFQKKADDKAK